jgi:hypothetical protein
MQNNFNVIRRAILFGKNFIKYILVHSQVLGTKNSIKDHFCFRILSKPQAYFSHTEINEN